MLEKHAPFPIEYDETRKCWKVELKDRQLDCDSESDAIVISDIPRLYEKLSNYNSLEYDDYFINRLQKTVDIIDTYKINCWASRKLLAIYKQISRKHGW